MLILCKVLSDSLMESTTKMQNSGIILGRMGAIHEKLNMHCSRYIQSGTEGLIFPTKLIQVLSQFNFHPHAETFNLSVLMLLTLVGCPDTIYKLKIH